MTTFNVGETIILSCEVKNASGVYYDPATSMNIEVNRLSPSFANVVPSTAMSPDAVGKYHYDFASSGQAIGRLQAVYIATDGQRITIEKDTFELS